MQANTAEPNELQTLRAAVQEWAKATQGHESAVLGVSLVIWEFCTLSRCFAHFTGGFNLKNETVKLSREYLFSAES